LAVFLFCRGLCLTQLGVDSNTAIVIGGLANKPIFFGSNTAETNSRADTSIGGWNEDFAPSVTSAYPWFEFGGQSRDDNKVGVFAFYGYNNIAPQLGHRTILSGY
jgi:hypothetical protein